MLDFANRAPKDFAPGIGRAVADRTVARLIEKQHDQVQFRQIELARDDAVSLDDQVAKHAKNEGLLYSGYHVSKGDDLTVQLTLYVTGEIRREAWSDVAERVSLGNCSLHPESFAREILEMRTHMRNATVLMSGRHLQHGDGNQSNRPQEVFTNCFDHKTKILTQEFGAVEIGKISGETVHVIAGDGQVRPARINAHGEQDLQRISFRAVKGGGGNFRKEVVATPNHRWVLRDGGVTTSLALGDVIAANPDTDGDIDAKAVVHGLVYGDGTAHKGRRDNSTRVSQGRTYASLRVCKQDAVRDEIHDILDAAGYGYTTPPHAKGDRVYYIGKLPYAKELPFTCDPEYIKGFIKGWWLADGSKAQFDSTEISTADAEAAQWLEDHAAYAGYTVTMHRVMERREGDGSYANGKPLHFLRMRKGVEWKVDGIEYEGRGEVFCPEEPVTRAFVLANGLLTGNCSTAAATFVSFYLLLNGSGVGRDYSDDMMAVDYADMPIVVPAIDWGHGDVSAGLVQGYQTVSEIEHIYAGREIAVFKVPDSREGWAEALAQIESMAFQKRRDEVLILDFSNVRPNGSPIAGMQGRPASGPGPLMSAILNVAKLRDAGMPAWRAALYADHYAAAVVLVGGARRAARMSTKFWRDPGVIDFIRVKAGGQFLWSSNNSVTVDAEFWALVRAAQSKMDDNAMATLSRDELLARRVYIAVIDASYSDGTGEPGFINVDTFKPKIGKVGTREQFREVQIINPTRLKLDEAVLELVNEVSWRGINSAFPMITNPCGEIQLVKWGGYCVIADVVPYHAESLAEAEAAFRAATRALIRTNLMPALYQAEVRRTNRIGVGFTGLHEFAMKFFGFGWKDIVDEKVSIAFWEAMAAFSRAVKDEAEAYATKLGAVVPHTDTTVKPAGCASLDTSIKTDAGPLSMRALFALSGYDEAAIAEMKPGQFLPANAPVVVFDENNNPQTVQQLYVNGVKEVFEIEFEDGTTAKLTGNHKLMTPEGWKRVDELTEADEVIHH